MLALARARCGNLLHTSSRAKTDPSVPQQSRFIVRPNETGPAPRSLRRSGEKGGSGAGRDPVRQATHHSSLSSRNRPRPGSLRRSADDAEALALVEHLRAEQQVQAHVGAQVLAFVEDRGVKPKNARGIDNNPPL